MNQSKVLGKKDEASEDFINYLFEEGGLENPVVDRFHYDILKKVWVTTCHYQCDDVNNIDISEITAKEQPFLDDLRERVEFEQHIFLHPEIIRSEEEKIIFFRNGIKKEVTFREASDLFRQHNNQCVTHHQKRTGDPWSFPLKIQNDFSKILLRGDVTYGTNMDCIFYSEKHQRHICMEFLLCEEQQRVTPHTSHPNRYWNKNKQKFMSIYSIQEYFKIPLLLVNYAKEGTRHAEEILVMQIEGIDKNDVNPLLTKNYPTTREKFQQSIRMERASKKTLSAGQAKKL